MSGYEEDTKVYFVTTRLFTRFATISNENLPSSLSILATTQD